MEHVELGPLQEKALQIGVGVTDILIQRRRLWNTYSSQKPVIASGVAIVVMRRLELQAQQKWPLPVASLEPLHGDVSVNIRRIPLHLTALPFAASEGRVKIPALPFDRHMFLIAFGLAPKVPFPNQPGLITRLL